MSDYVLLYMWLTVCVRLYVNVCIVCFCAFVYFPTYCGGCLMRGKGYLLNGQHLIPWARVCRVDIT